MLSYWKFYFSVRIILGELRSITSHTYSALFLMLYSGSIQVVFSSRALSTVTRIQSLTHRIMIYPVFPSVYFTMHSPYGNCTI